LDVCVCVCVCVCVGLHVLRLWGYDLATQSVFLPFIALALGAFALRSQLNVNKCAFLHPHTISSLSRVVSFYVWSERAIDSFCM
jgi:hypothetical protein